MGTFFNWAVSSTGMAAARKVRVVNPVRRPDLKTYNIYAARDVFGKEVGEKIQHAYTEVRTCSEVLYDEVADCNFSKAVEWALLFEDKLVALKRISESIVPPKNPSGKYYSMLADLRSDIAAFDAFKHELARLMKGCSCERRYGWDNFVEYGD